MRQIAKDHPEHIANIAAELDSRRKPGMTDAEIMHQIGLSMRAVHDTLPAEQQTDANKQILQDCATEVADQQIGLDRAATVVRRLHESGAVERLISILTKGEPNGL